MRKGAQGAAAPGRQRWREEVREMKKEVLGRGLEALLSPDLKESVSDTERVKELGLDEIETVFQYLGGSDLTNQLVFDVTLARGLSYYTGCIFEVNVDTEAHPEVKMGSIGGGGRYADLTSIFGMKDMHSG